MITSHFIVIDNEHFPLAEGEEEEVRERIVAAVRAGGDFVTLRHDPRRVVEVLVTAATPVHIDHIVRDDIDARARDADDAEGRLMGEDLQWWLDTID
ncbi:hypothetical protein FVP74_07365 [Microbacterium saccharophilum]|uniref:Uncharacterized protein n=1 Tax=Microbacterium saccharophilum TaxID=1213358 RepID=A0A5C8I5V7_9MICO|nr:MULTISPECIES: hypothetical protein [Microbacterium]TXK14372.1 hypothetical protein FVP74_07365 [Microbacterium saccharophilum]SFI21700.1 hypothetical protein SAMN04487751_0441 [Microbacterium saccharophilum]